MLLKTYDRRNEQTRERLRGWLRQDLDQVSRLMEELACEYDGEDFDSERCRRRTARLKRRFNDPREHVQVIRVGAELVGICAISRSCLPGIDGTVHSVYVQPEFRGYGFGRKLLQGLIEYARSVGMESLEMPLSRNPDAVRLYQSLGFEVYQWQGKPHLFKMLID